MNSFLKIVGYTIRDQMRLKSFYVLLGLSILFVLMIRGCFNGQYVVSGKQLDNITVAWYVSKFVFQVIASGMFLIVILGVTHKRASPGFAGIAVGLCLTLIHLISIPVTNTSVNPARSTGPALFAGGWALQQLWLFWVAPIAGAVLAGWLSRAVLDVGD